jgi:hypothetical protein
LLYCRQSESRYSCFGCQSRYNEDPAPVLFVEMLSFTLRDAH